MKILLRKIHRWLGLLMALQLLAWMASGFWFSLYPIEEIRGEHLTREAEPIAAEQLKPAAAFGVVRNSLDDAFGSGWRLDALDVQLHAGQALWRVAGHVDDRPFRRLVRADGGGIVPRMTATQAGRRASDWLRTPAEPVNTAWIEPGAGGHDLRGRAGPAWKVTFELPEAVDLYIDPWTGELLARRTDRWRLFDFMWMLHIMDYDAREDFHHPLLQVAAAAGLLVVLSGFLYWLWTRRPLWAGGRRRKGS